MRLEDIQEGVQIERQSFSSTWPASAYRRELEENRMARYLVVRYTPAPGETVRRPEPLPETRRPFPFSLLAPFQSIPPLPQRESIVAGYAGLWLMVDEAHITSIAVRPDFRGLGLGTLLMLGVAQAARQLGGRWLTLEVRVSNTVAQQLYRKFGFREAGVRRRYYTDNNEDALIMWSEEISSPPLLARLAAIRQELEQRLEWDST